MGRPELAGAEPLGASLGSACCSRYPDKRADQPAAVTSLPFSFLRSEPPQFLLAPSRTRPPTAWPTLPGEEAQRASGPLAVVPSCRRAVVPFAIVPPYLRTACVRAYADTGPRHAGIARPKPSPIPRASKHMCAHMLFHLNSRAVGAGKRRCKQTQRHGGTLAPRRGGPEVAEQQAKTLGPAHILPVLALALHAVFWLLALPSGSEALARWHGGPARHTRMQLARQKTSFSTPPGPRLTAQARKLYHRTAGAMSNGHPRAFIDSPTPWR